MQVDVGDSINAVQADVVDGKNVYLITNGKGVVLYGLEDDLRGHIEDKDLFAIKLKQGM